MRVHPVLGRLVLVLLTLWVALIPAVVLAAPVAPTTPAPKVADKPRVSAGAAVVMDWRTGLVLFDKGAHQPRDPASTTKVMTALLALEKGKLDDQVKVSRKAAYTPGSSMYIKPGETYSLHDLLHGLLLRSGNDAAAAIAEHISGSVPEFAKLMTQRAHELGAKQTTFKNPHGLTQPGHVTTAYDLALIAREALQNETFRNIVSMPHMSLTYEYLHRDVVLHNTNRLLHMIEGADGVKTGTTAAAGACLVASATRNGQKLISVVLHAGNRWNDSAQLLEWGFEHFQLAYLGREGEVLLAAPVKAGKQEAVPLRLSRDLPLVTTRQPGPQPKVEVQLHEQIEAPIKQGQVLGKVVARYDGQIAEAELVAAQMVERASILDYIKRGLRPLSEWLSGVEM